jgi:hypothetical protein
MANEKDTDYTRMAVLQAEMARDIAYMKDDVRDIKTNVQQGYVTKEEFEPIKRFVYGLVAAFTVALVGAVVTLLVTLR